MSKYTYRTSASDVAQAVMAVARSTARSYEFASGPALDAANEAASLGLLQAVSNGAFELGQAGESVAVSKDPVAYIMNYTAILAWTLANGDKRLFNFDLPAPEQA